MGRASGGLVLAVVAISFARSVKGDIPSFNDIIQKMEKNAIDLARETERLFENRCDSHMFAKCEKSNYDHCLSSYPNAVCLGGGLENVEYYRPDCGEHESQCSSLRDPTNSMVFSVNRDEQGEPVDPLAREAICYTKGLDEWFVQRLKEDREFWESLGVGPHRLMGFVSNTGVFRLFPGRTANFCGRYDARLRPFYTSAQSGPKNILILLDVSEAMQEDDREAILKAAASRVVSSVSYRDRLAIIPFSSEASSIVNEDGFMFQGSGENIGLLQEQINNLRIAESGRANYSAAFSEAFDVWEKTNTAGLTVNCKTAILFFTAGEAVDPSVTEFVDTVVFKTKELEAASSHQVAVFTFSVNSADFESDLHVFPKELSCKSEIGVWSQISNVEEVNDSLFSYFNLFALALANDTEFVSWSEPFQYGAGGHSGASASAPVFARNHNPPLFLGVTEVSIVFAALDVALGVYSGYGGTEATISKFISTTNARCPNLEVTDCLLESFRRRSSGGRPVCGNITTCQNQDMVEIEVESCPNAETDLPMDLYDNRNFLGMPALETICCVLGETNPTDQCPAASSSGDDSSKGALIGGIIGGVTFLVIAAVAVLFAKKKEERAAALREEQAAKDRREAKKAAKVSARSSDTSGNRPEKEKHEE